MTYAVSLLAAFCWLSIFGATCLPLDGAAEDIGMKTLLASPNFDSSVLEWTFPSMRRA